MRAAPGPGGRALEVPSGGDLYYLNVSVLSPLWRLPRSGGQPSKALDGVLWFNVWPLDRGFCYIDRDSADVRLGYLQLDSGQATTIADNLGEVSSGLTASPDGRTIPFTRIDASVDDLMLVEDFR